MIKPRIVVTGATGKTGSSVVSELLKVAQSEQAFSGDGGKTWETNWINKYTRANDPTLFNHGSWQPSPHQ